MTAEAVPVHIAVALPAGKGEVSADWERPDDAWAAIAVAHGAGTGYRHPFLLGFTRRLQAEGIAAGVLQDIQDLMEDDPGLAKRGALMDIEHARLGRFGHVRTPISFSRDRIEAFRAPNLGEHSREIAGLAGMDAGRFESLESLGVFR